MIVVDTENKVVGSAPLIERVDMNNENNLIKVNVYPDLEYGYFLIGTQDRDLYKIYEDTTQPDPDKLYLFSVLENGSYHYEEILLKKPDWI